MPGARWYNVYSDTSAGKHLITNEKPALIARCTKCFEALLAGAARARNPDKHARARRAEYSLSSARYGVQ